MLGLVVLAAFYMISLYHLFSFTASVVFYYFSLCIWPALYLCIHVETHTLFLFPCCVCHTQHSLCFPLLVLFSFSLCCSFYLTHTAIVKPWVQMFHLLPTSIHHVVSQKTPWTQQNTSAMADPASTQHPPLDTTANHTNTLEEQFFCWPMLSGTLLPNGFGWAELRSEHWNDVWVRMRVKCIKVIWQTFNVIAFVLLWHYQQCSADGCLKSTSLHSYSACLPQPPCGEKM